MDLVLASRARYRALGPTLGLSGFPDIFNYLSLSLKLLVFPFSQLRYEIPKSAYEISKSAIFFLPSMKHFYTENFSNSPCCFHHGLWLYFEDKGAYLRRVIQIEKWSPAE